MQVGLVVAVSSANELEEALDSLVGAVSCKIRKCHVIYAK